jgi:glycosyltransferase involved in cell wall biosynthesis
MSTRSCPFISSVRLSVIVPVYNVEPYLRQCLDSVFDGTADTKYEVIIVNDGSTDGSAAIIDEYRQRFDNCIVIEQENQGLSAARMNGLAKAVGEYVWFVDSDDWLDPGAIERSCKMIEASKGYSVYCIQLRIHSNESDSSVSEYRIDHSQIRDGWDLLQGSFPHGRVQRYIILRSLFEQPWLYFPHGHLYEDMYFCRVLLVLGGTVFVSDCSLYHYRSSRPGSITNTVDIRSSYDIVSLYSQLKSFSEILTKPERKLFMTSCQWLLCWCYRVNEPIWHTPAFRRFMRRKAPYLLSELFRNTCCYSFKEWAAAFLLLISPSLFRQLFPINS